MPETKKVTHELVGRWGGGQRAIYAGTKEEMVGWFNKKVASHRAHGWKVTVSKIGYSLSARKMAPYGLKVRRIFIKKV